MIFPTSLPILATIVCLLTAPAVRAAETVPRPRPSINAERVLFLGNSITHHPPLASIGWEGDWGMAASAKDKDYVHLVVGALTTAAGRAPAFMDANIAEFERNLATYDIATVLKPQVAFKADLVVIAIGENVPPLAADADKTLFASAFAKLLAAVDGGRTAIVVRGCFWPDAAKDEIMRRRCEAVGGTFVDITALGRDEANYARAERTIANGGVAMHPGDAGMRAIAGAIVQALQPERK